MAGLHKKSVLMNFLVIVLIFILGVFVGNVWNSAETSVEKTLKSSELEGESFLVERELFETFETSCSFAKTRLSALTGDLVELGKMLDSPNAKVDLGDENYNFLKKKYHLNQIRTYILEKSLMDDCGDSSNVILYYYTQGDENSSLQGIVLDELVAEKGIHVYAVEHSYASELEFLEYFYQINSTPALVVNYDTVLEGVQQKEEISLLLYG